TRFFPSTHHHSCFPSFQLHLDFNYPPYPKVRLLPPSWDAGPGHPATVHSARQRNAITVSSSLYNCILFTIGLCGVGGTTGHLA
ncbi:hypothetical protein B0H11DRAFT_1815238, partial [Mycena galericulata]